MHAPTDSVFSVTDFHCASPSHETMEINVESKVETMEINVESKVGPSLDTEELVNDYMEYKEVAQEDDYIDYTGL